MMRPTPNQPITSRENEKIRHLRALAEPKERKKSKAFLIEGIKMVEEALGTGAPVAQVIAAPSLLRRHGKSVLTIAASRGVDVLWVSEHLMDVIAESKTPQPVMAEVRIAEHSANALLAPEQGLIVIAHQLQDPGNLGTIIRTCEAVSASGVAITQNTVDPYGPKAVRASMGSILRVPVAKIDDAGDFLKACQEKGFQTVALVVQGKETHFDLDLTKPTALVAGQEGAGLPDDMMQAVDHRVTIPMSPAIDSLNVATATAVVLYEAMRQRKKK
jgi:TrmH family RNA methyltransferase